MTAAPVRHRIVVTDGDQRSALAAVRALGRAGHDVFVCAGRAQSLAGASRYSSGSAVVPDPLHHPEEFADAVAAAIHAWKADVLMPMTDASMLASLADRERFAPARLPFVDFDRYRAISDKHALLAAASRVGIAVPEQQTVCLEDVPKLDRLKVTCPVVVKPARSVGERDGRRASFCVRYARDATELAEIVRTTNPAAFPLLLQQRVVGPGVGVFVLVWEGQTVAAFAHQRIREKPPSGGVSVYREAIPVDPELLARSRALLDRFGWCGVAMIEYKVDARTGTPYLMEINARFWGSLQLAIDAGVDFPNLLLSVALDGARPAMPTYRAGVRSRWWWGDVDQLLMRFRQSDTALSLPPGAPSRARALWEFLHLWRPKDRNEVLRFDDPRPFVRESIDWVRHDLLRKSR